MNIGGRWDRTPLTDTEKAAAVDVVVAAVEAGITLFDHRKNLQSRERWKPPILMGGGNRHGV